jgi:putative nucleotidyltransferase with HDIG domain
MSQSTLRYLALAEKTRRELLHKSDLIPPLPDLVARLLGVLNNQNTEPADLEGLLQNDQVLVAKMLAMVNSPFYGLHRTIRTIKDAVMVLGFRGVRSLVLATSTAKFLQRDFRCYGHQPKGLWLHAVCVAAGSRCLARICRMSQDDAELLFVAGLLHDIGKLLLVSYLNENDAGVAMRGGVCDRERATVGLDHAEAGALVTAKWNLAAEIQQVIAAHHGGGDASAAPMTAVVRLADAVAHERGIGYQPGAAPVGESQPADLATLGLTAESWAGHREQLVNSMDEAIAALGSLSA